MIPNPCPTGTPGSQEFLAGILGFPGIWAKIPPWCPPCVTVHPGGGIGRDREGIGKGLGTDWEGDWEGIRNGSGRDQRRDREWIKKDWEGIRKGLGRSPRVSPRTKLQTNSRFLGETSRGNRSPALDAESGRAAQFRFN